MKKLIMFVMVLMLCMGTAAKADLVAAWDFNETLESYPGAGDYPAEMYEGAEEYDGMGAPPGGSAIALDGTNSVKLPIEAVNPLDHTADWSIALWFKVPEMAADEGVMLLSSARDNVGDNHSYGLFLESGASGETGPQGCLRVDMFYVATVISDTSDLDDGTWHHAAVVFDSATGFTTLYVDGVEDGTNDEIGETIPNIAEDTVLIGDTLNTEFPAEEGVGPLVGSIAHVGIFDEALDVAGVQEAMDNGFPGTGPKNPIKVDPNQMDIYETGETEGNFVVSLKFPPMGQGSPGNPEFTPLTVDITVDPNSFGGGGNPDFTLIGGSDPHNRITFTRTVANWDTPVVIRFKAVDDGDAEPPTLDEAHSIYVWAEPVATTEPNWSRPVAQKLVGVTVWDNDQPNILFRYTPANGGARVDYDPTKPIRIWEEPELYQGNPRERWRKIGFQLQIPPDDGDPCTLVDAVKLNAEVTGDIEGNNLPTTVVTLPYVEANDPNGYTFTSTTSTNGLPTGCADWSPATKTSCWNAEQDIKIWGTDDALLQVEAADPCDQFYSATLSVWVIDAGGDELYGEAFDEDNAKTVDIWIEDNECGAFGTLSMDVSNPYYVMDEETLGGDPNDWMDGDGNPIPDCYVDMSDAIEVAIRWLKCTDPQGDDCVKLN